MTFRALIPPPDAYAQAGRVSALIILRLVLALLVCFVLIVPSLAGGRPLLKQEVVAGSEVLTLGDLVEGAPAEAAGTPLFRAPALGQTGTIQARRILDAVRPLGLTGIDTGGRAQVVVTRAARRIGAAEIETAVKHALETQHGIETQALSIAFEGPSPVLIVGTDVQGQPVAEEVVYDRRSRRLSATVWIGPGSGERKAVARVSGTAVEYTEVAVLTRALARGETVQAGDLAIERRAKTGLPADAATEALGLAGRIARRPLQAGTLVRTGDLARPELVGRGDVVTIVYEVPGMVLSLRGRATEAGALGDVIAVVNPQSKKTLQAQVIAPGKVSVGAPLPGRIAATAMPLQP